MTRIIRRAVRMIKATAVGMSLAAFAGCTSEDLRVQIAGGLRTTLNGLLNIATTTFANELLDIDD